MSSASVASGRTQARVYLDHNATTAPGQEIRARLDDWLLAWGNPSSIHADGRSPKAILRDARDQLARHLGVSALELVFCSGGTEGNNTILRQVMAAQVKAGRPEVVVSAVEHPAVRRVAEEICCEDPEKKMRLHIISVDRSGRFDLEALAQLLRERGERIGLISCMLANNETGHLMPVAQVVELARSHGVLVHTDAVQALGKMELNLRALGVDYATFSGHKFYALKGSGLIYIKKNAPFESLLAGGGQERHRRGGTENVLAIASLGEVVRQRGASVAAKAVEMAELRDWLESRIIEMIPGVFVTGGDQPRLPNTSSLVVSDVDGETLLMNLDLAGYAVSTGAACSAGNPEPSPVLLAMGLSHREAQSSLRISLGWENTQTELLRFSEDLARIVARVRDLRRRYATEPQHRMAGV